MQRTLSIIKPDAVAAGKSGEVIRRLENAGFTIKALKMVKMSKAQAEGFYAVHKERPFFQSLTDFMSSGPCVTIVLEAENVITRYRELMGATDPAQAAPGTIRKDLATNKEKNAVHGSDAPETAATEIAYFFTGYELNG